MCSLGTTRRRPSPGSRKVPDRVMFSTRPVVSSIVILSPIRIGCVAAIMIPATRLATDWRAARPTITPGRADEARGDLGAAPDHEPVDPVGDHQRAGQGDRGGDPVAVLLPEGFLHGAFRSQ